MYFLAFFFVFSAHPFSSSPLLPTLLVKIFIFCNYFCVTLPDFNSTMQHAIVIVKCELTVVSFALHGFTTLFSVEREELGLATVSNSSLAFLADFQDFLWTLLIVAPR